MSVRIAYLCNVYPAVSHSFVRREIEAIEAAGHEVRRFSVRPAKPNLKDEADLRELAATQTILSHGAALLFANVIGLSLSRPGKALAALGTALRLAGPGVGTKARHIAYWIEAAWLARSMAHSRIEHLHAHFGTNPAAVAALAHAWGGPPFSFTVHGPDEFDAPVSLALTAKAQAASFVVAISSYCRSQLMRWTDATHWDKIRLVRCGLDRSFLETAPRPVSDSTEFLCVARLSAQKGLPLLIGACDRLRSSGQKFTLTIIGDGELRESLQADIDSRGLGDCVRLAGSASSSEIRDALVRARAFVLPSFAEGLPVVLMEALAMSRPVITTAIAGIPELVDDDCGWLIPPGSEDALVDAMAEVLRATPQELNTKGAAGRQRVLAMHDARRNAGQILDAMAADYAGRKSLVLDDGVLPSKPVETIAHDPKHFGELAQQDEPRDKRRIARRQPAP